MGLLLRNGKSRPTNDLSGVFLPRPFDSLFDNLMDGFFTPATYERSGLTHGFQPTLDLRETEKEFEVYADLPGIDEKDVDLTFTDDTLIIKGERQKEHKETDKESNWYFEQRSFGQFERTIHIPAEIQRDNISASFKNGVLKVTLPKAPEAQTRVQKIKVN